jgi:hypothetical protein
MKIELTRIIEFPRGGGLSARVIETLADLNYERVPFISLKTGSGDTEAIMLIHGKDAVLIADVYVGIGWTIVTDKFRKTEEG